MTVLLVGCQSLHVPNGEFLQVLSDELIEGAYGFNRRTNNLRWGATRQTWRARVKGRAVESLGKRGFVRRDSASPEGLAKLLGDLALYDDAWGRFADDESHRIFARLLALRAFGDRHVRVPLDNVTYWADYDRCSHLVARGEAKDGGLGFELRLYDMRPFGFDLTVRCAALSVLDIFCSRQYELRRPDAIVAVQPNDIVIDGGAAWGEAAFMFAALAGPAGRVIAVEFVDQNTEVFRENMLLNPAEAERIELVEKALWNVADEQIPYLANGPGTHLGGNTSEHTATTITIDDIVQQYELPRVDFIKMDVEGCEQAALIGATETLRRFRPKLALSAYHRPEDLAVLPKHIEDLGLGYRFFLDHFTSYQEETVLFADPVTRE